MKFVSLPFVALFVTGAVARWHPDCDWDDCLEGWTASDCGPGSGWNCLCNNSTAIAQVNTCVAKTCQNLTDQEAVYGAVAQLCANRGVTVTNTQEATFSATSGGTVYPTITDKPGWGPGGYWDFDDWSDWISACSSAVGSAPSDWHGEVWGDWRSDRHWWHGPWDTRADSVDCSHWTTWTAGWGPHSSWTGTWSGCSTITATPAPATVTKTITTNGVASVVTGTTFGVQAQAVVATGSSNAAAPTDAVSIRVFGGAAAAFFGLMVAL